MRLKEKRHRKFNSCSTGILNRKWTLQHHVCTHFFNVLIFTPVQRMHTEKEDQHFFQANLKEWQTKW